MIGKLQGEGGTTVQGGFGKMKPQHDVHENWGRLKKKKKKKKKKKTGVQGGADRGTEEAGRRRRPGPNPRNK